MKKQSIAIVGLGKVGSAFLEELLGQSNDGVEIVAVVEKNDNSPGLALAQSHGIKRLSIAELVGMGEELDILFDLTDEATVRQELRDKMRITKNRHTIIATENIARMVWSLIARGADLPGAHDGAGY